MMLSAALCSDGEAMGLQGNLDRHAVTLLPVLGPPELVTC
jgi:hypothetical protein